MVLSSSGNMNRDWSWNIKQSRGIHISVGEIKEFGHIIGEIKMDQNRPDKTEEKQTCVGGWGYIRLLQNILEVYSLIEITQWENNPEYNMVGCDLWL